MRDPDTVGEQGEFRVSPGCHLEEDMEPWGIELRLGDSETGTPVAAPSRSVAGCLRAYRASSAIPGWSRGTSGTLDGQPPQATG